MGWNVIRTATTGDKMDLEVAAMKFAKRHKITVEDSAGLRYPATKAVECEVEYKIYSENDKYLARLWHTVVARTLGHKRAEGIVCDAVGYHVKN